MKDPLFARVAVNIPHLSGMFDYAIPQELLGEIKTGSLVTIPFGKQVTQGIVVSLLDDPGVPDPKLVNSLVEKDPVVNEKQIDLAKWMADENLSTLSVCLDLMLPPGLGQHADILIHLVEQETSTDLTATQTRIVSLLRKRGDLRGKQLDRSLSRMDWRKSLPGLVKQGIIQSKPVLQTPTTKAKTGRAVRLIAMPNDNETDKRLGKLESPIRLRRIKALEFLQNETEPVNIAFVYAESGANAADLALLEKLNLIQFFEIEIQRDPLARINPVQTEEPTLTLEQDQVVRHLKEELNDRKEKKPNLLQGVTSSGKTEVYLQTVKECLRFGKQAVILVPEISLTPQTVSRFLGRFPGQVGLIHSKLSAGERYDTWRRIRSGELSVVVGARSALFAPLDRLGLIIIDECHDSSYHQEDIDPRYHAVSTALAYSKMTNSVIVLGSATPEVEQLYYFNSQKWNLFQLPNRVLAHQAIHPLTPGTIPNSLPLPEVEVVDMRAELVAGNRSSLSRSLQEALTQVLAKKIKQSFF